MKRSHPHIYHVGPLADATRRLSSVLLSLLQLLDRPEVWERTVFQPSFHWAFSYTIKGCLTIRGCLSCNEAGPALAHVCKGPRR